MLKKDQKTSHHFREKVAKSYLKITQGKEKKKIKKRRGKSTELNTVNKISEKKGQASVGFANSSKAWIALGAARTKCSGSHKDIRRGFSWELVEVWKRSQKHSELLPFSRALLSPGERLWLPPDHGCGKGEMNPSPNPNYSHKPLQRSVNFLFNHIGKAVGFAINLECLWCTVSRTCPLCPQSCVEK